MEEEMNNPPRQTMECYCRKTDVGHISFGFQLANPITFDIQNFVLLDLRENPFNEQEPWEHLNKFYETSLTCKSNDVTDDQEKLGCLVFL